MMRTNITRWWQKMLKTKITYYRYDISDKEQKKAYDLLKLEQKKKGIKVFDHISINSYAQKTEFYNKIKEMEQREFIELETKFIFNNQWNTTEDSHNLRVFDWSEEIYPNEDIKEGYYLDVTKEMHDIRKNTFRCGFCGKQYTKEERKNLIFCNACFGSEYLTEKDLYLLRLKRIDDKTPRLQLNECDKEVLKKILVVD